MFSGEAEYEKTTTRESPPERIYMLQNKVTGEYWRRYGTKTPSIWATQHGAVNAKATISGNDWRIRVYDVR